MSKIHKPGVNNWLSGRHKNTYTITREVLVKPIPPKEVLDEQVVIPEQTNTSELSIDETKIIEEKPKNNIKK